MSEKLHIPVMCDEVVAGLSLQPGGCYVDATFGGGGHARAMLTVLTGGSVYAFDQDEYAEVYAKALKGVHFIPTNFRHMRAALAERGVHHVSGILADLGMSTQQLYSPERGFGSMHADAMLDMRMQQSSTAPTADALLNHGTSSDLRHIFSAYGELPQTGRIVRAVIAARERTPLRTVGQLKALLQAYVPAKQPARFWAQVFQALRIAVNKELDVLREFLLQSAQLLVAGGRLVVISYHSLEDRLVKRFLQYGHFERVVHTDDYGRPLPVPFSALYKKPLRPLATELAINPSARSAKLRVGVKQSSLPT